MRPINECWRGVAGRALRAIAPVLLVLAPAAPVAAQESGRMWAAQTGANQVTLAWDSVPGAYEYRIFAGSPEALTGNLRARPSVAWLSGSGRSAIVSGIQRLTSDLTLVATDRSGRVLQKKRFNRITRATAFAPVQPPDEVTAEASTATEVTVTWTPVPGATAYFIGRAAGPSGLRVLCTLCSTEARYVDHDVAPGIVHSYVVSAIFPSGMSQRAFSNQVTPGATQLATMAGTGKPIAQPVDGQNEGGSGSTPGGGVPQPGTATTAGGAVHTATPVATTTATPMSGQ